MTTPIHELVPVPERGHDLRLGMKEPDPTIAVPRLSATLGPSDLPNPYPAVDLSWRVPSFPMLLNDGIGDCAPVALLHAAQLWSAAALKVPRFAPKDADAEQLYAEVAGYDPSDPSTDQGTDPAQMMRYVYDHGFAGGRVEAFASIDYHDQRELEQAHWLFGGLLFGLILPRYAADQWRAGQPWDVVSPRSDPYGGETWGGHMVYGVDYTPHGPTVVTWGTLHKMTWAFLRECGMVVYAVMPGEWAGRVPYVSHHKGFDHAHLRHLIDELKAANG